MDSISIYMWIIIITHQKNIFYSVIKIKNKSTLNLYRNYIFIIYIQVNLEHCIKKRKTSGIYSSIITTAICLFIQTFKLYSILFTFYFLLSYLNELVVSVIFSYILDLFLH